MRNISTESKDQLPVSIVAWPLFYNFFSYQGRLKSDKGSVRLITKIMILSPWLVVARPRWEGLSNEVAALHNLDWNKFCWKVEEDEEGNCITPVETHLL